MAHIPIIKIAKMGKTTNIATKTIIRIPYQVEKNDIISSYNVVAIIIQRHTTKNNHQYSNKCWVIAKSHQPELMAFGV